MQRRRRKKAAPKNIFGSAAQTPQKSKPNVPSKTHPPRARSQIAAPPSAPGAKKKDDPPPPSERLTKADISESEVKSAAAEEPAALEEPAVEAPQSVETQQTNLEEKGENDILQDQILGKPSRKDIGLEKKKDHSSDKASNEQDEGKSLKARQIIQNSRNRASIAVEQAKTQKKTHEKTVETPKKPQRKFRNKTSSYQPANRARRLDRSRHMEYKYEMRGLLSEIGIAEEHRSNLLATIWARGERQTTNEAKDFLMEKLDEGIIDDNQLTSLEKIVDGYTVRR
ncbi:MAG: hypothetical protein CMA59_04930 [Euryarchaeota archaeon]|nr:hypothetical protein [Euryarchaeota archaeon]